jgi:hypothetical protein
MYHPNYKSKCCKAKLKVSIGVKDFPRQVDTHGQTFFYICQKCKKPCDILEENNKIRKTSLWQITRHNIAS